MKRPTFRLIGLAVALLLLAWALHRSAPNASSVAVRGDGIPSRDETRSPRSSQPEVGAAGRAAPEIDAVRPQVRANAPARDHSGIAETAPLGEVVRVPAHPSSPLRDRMARERAFLELTKQAAAQGDVSRLRAHLAEYDAEPRTGHVEAWMQAFAVVADCLERGRRMDRAVVDEFLASHRGSPARRTVRSYCESHEDDLHPVE